MRFVLTRIASVALVLWGVTTLVFFLIHWLPGDPVDVMLGDYAQAADREELRKKLGLDQSLLVQYWVYLKGVVTLNWGTSFYDENKTVFSLIRETWPASLELALSSLLVAVLIAFPLGILAAVRKNTPWDQGAMAFSLLGVSVPNILLGPVLILVFSLWLGWFPVSGREASGSLVLPSITLGTAMAAILSRMMRSSLLEVLNEDYIRTARAKGLSERAVILKHALRNALLPVVTLLGLQLGGLLAGAVITETIFAWPGIGKLTVDAILSRNYPVVQACVLVVSVFYVLINILTDLLYAWIDPRIRQGGLR